MILKLKKRYQLRLTYKLKDTAGLLLSPRPSSNPHPLYPKNFIFLGNLSFMRYIIVCMDLLFAFWLYPWACNHSIVLRPGSPTLAKTNAILRFCAPRAFTYGPKNFGKLALASLAVRCAHSRVFLKFVHPISSALVSQPLKLRLFSLTLR